MLVGFTERDRMECEEGVRLPAFMGRLGDAPSQSEEPKASEGGGGLRTPDGRLRAVLLSRCQGCVVFDFEEDLL